MSEKATSIKQLIQQMVPENVGLVKGAVVKTSPLSIQVVNNPKMILSGSNLVIPKHLTDYITSVDITMPAGAIITSKTKNAADHTHDLDTFSIQGAQMTVKNSLKKGEKVYMLRFNGGKQYYVLDRVVS